MLGNYVEVELHGLPLMGERVVEDESQAEGGFCWICLELKRSGGQWQDGIEC